MTYREKSRQTKRERVREREGERGERERGRERGRERERERERGVEEFDRMIFFFEIWVKALNTIGCSIFEVTDVTRPFVPGTFFQESRGAP